MPEDWLANGTHQLAHLIEQNTGEDGFFETPIPRLFLIRSSQPSEAIYTVCEPALCLVAQGRKRVIAGQSIHYYDNTQYLVATVEVPAVGQIIDSNCIIEEMNERGVHLPASATQKPLKIDKEIYK